MPAGIAGDEVIWGLEPRAQGRMGVAFSRARMTLWLTPKMEKDESPRICQITNQSKQSIKNPE